MASCSAAARVAITACGNALAIRSACAADDALAWTATRLLWPTGVAVTFASSAPGVSCET